MLPILYHITPQDVDEVIRLYEEGHVEKGIHGSTVELVPGTPHPKGMFRPCYPFIEPVPGVVPEPEVETRDKDRGFLTRLASMLRKPGRDVATYPRRKLRVGAKWLVY